MVVCLCHGVSQAAIEEILDAGADSVPEIQQRCSAGSDCGSCVHRLRELLDRRETHDRNATPPRPSNPT